MCSSRNGYAFLEKHKEPTEDEIRQAYRNVARLLHPDRQQKPEIRRLAESQMTRLNGIVETLTDSSRRRIYDAQLGGTRVRVSRRSRKRRWWDELLFRRDPATTIGDHDPSAPGRMADPTAGLQMQFPDGDGLHVHIVTHGSVERKGAGARPTRGTDRVTI